MSKKEFYGWDIYKEEGLSELKKIKQSKIFSGKDKFQGLIDRYIKLYSKKRKYPEEITGKDLYPEKVVDDDTKPAFDKAYRTIAEFKKLLKLYYEKGEGQTSQFEIYFIAETRDYRLGIRQKEQIREEVTIKEKSMQSININKLNNFFNKIGDKILNFWGIYYEAFFAPYKLADRVSKTSNFKWDTILIFLSSTFLVLLLAYFYRDVAILYLSSGKDINLDAANFILFSSGMIIYSLESYFILNIIAFIFLSVILPWQILNLLNLKISLYKFANYHFYIMLSWAPLLISFQFKAKKNRNY